MLATVTHFAVLGHMRQHNLKEMHGEMLSSIALSKM